MTPHSQHPSRPATSMGKPMNQGILKTAENSPPLAPLHQNPPYNHSNGYNNYPPPPPQPQYQKPPHPPNQLEDHYPPPPMLQQHQQPVVIHHHPIQHQQPPQQNPQPLRQQQAVNLSADHYMLLQYIKQNPSVFNDFGIEIPKKLYNLVDDLAFPENHHHHHHNGRHQTPVQPVPPTPQNRGRYLKNGTQNNFNPRFRRTYDVSQKQMPENRRQSMQVRPMAEAK